MKFFTFLKQSKRLTRYLCGTSVVAVTHDRNTPGYKHDKKKYAWKWPKGFNIKTCPAWLRNLSDEEMKNADKESIHLGYGGILEFSVSKLQNAC